LNLQKVGKGSEEAVMIEVKIDSIRVSLMSNHRVVILKDLDSERYLPIWIGPYEADAITVQLQEVEVARPLTHDLLKTLITQLGGKILHIVVNELRSDTFYANIIIERNGQRMEIDSRPSDAIALAVRANVPIYVEESVMEHAAITPEEEAESREETPSAFKDLIEGLDLDKLGGS
jgi:bifunctional DNase/RNase